MREEGTVLNIPSDVLRACGGDPYDPVTYGTVAHWVSDMIEDHVTRDEFIRRAVKEKLVVALYLALVHRYVTGGVLGKGCDFKEVLEAVPADMRTRMLSNILFRKLRPASEEDWHTRLDGALIDVPLAKQMAEHVHPSELACSAQDPSIFEPEALVVLAGSYLWGTEVASMELDDNIFPVVLRGAMSIDLGVFLEQHSSRDALVVQEMCERGDVLLYWGELELYFENRGLLIEPEIVEQLLSVVDDSCIGLYLAGCWRNVGERVVYSIAPELSKVDSLVERMREIRGRGGFWDCEIYNVDGLALCAGLDAEYWHYAAYGVPGLAAGLLDGRGGQDKAEWVKNALRSAVGDWERGALLLEEHRELSLEEVCELLAGV